MTADNQTGQVVANTVRTQLENRLSRKFDLFNVICAQMCTRDGIDWKLKINTGANEFIHACIYQPAPATGKPLEVIKVCDKQTEAAPFSY